MYKYIKKYIEVSLLILLNYLIFIVFYLQDFLAFKGDCHMNGNNFTLQYTLPSNRTIKGKSFSCNLLPYLKELKLLNNTDFVDLTKEKVPEPKVVTAISDNHLNEAGFLFKSFRKNFPNQKIIVYDLGLSRMNIKKVKKSCFVEYRKFNFSKYPKHVSNLKTYAFRLLIAAEVLKDYGAIFWADSSVRFKRSNLNNLYDLLNCYYGKEPNHSVTEQKKIGNRYRKISYKNYFRFKTCPTCYMHFGYEGFDKKVFKFNIKHCHKSPIMFHIPTFHGVLPTLHEDAYKYFPTDIEKYTNRTISREYDAAFSLIVKTEDSVNDVLKWAVLCALDKHCIQPVNWFDCPGHFTKENIFSKKHVCYRFDQSILSILLHNAHNYDIRNYVSEMHDLVTLEKQKSNNFNELI